MTCVLLSMGAWPGTATLTCCPVPFLNRFQVLAVSAVSAVPAVPEHGEGRELRAVNPSPGDGTHNRKRTVVRTEDTIDSSSIRPGNESTTCGP